MCTEAGVPVLLRGARLCRTLCRDGSGRRAAVIMVAWSGAFRMQQGCFGFCILRTPTAYFLNMYEALVLPHSPHYYNINDILHQYRGLQSQG